MTDEDPHDSTLSGTWHSRYWYPSNHHDGEDISEYEVTIRQNGNVLILQSRPNPEKSYMEARLVLDDNVVTGSWQENTSPTGEFQSLVYSGTVQLLINEARNKMTGMWLGIGNEHGKKHIYTGRWEIVRK